MRSLTLTACFLSHTFLSNLLIHLASSLLDNIAQYGDRNEPAWPFRETTRQSKSFATPPPCLARPQRLTYSHSMSCRRETMGKKR